MPRLVVPASSIKPACRVFGVLRVLIHPLMRVTDRPVEKLFFRGEVFLDDPVIGIPG